MSHDHSQHGDPARTARGPIAWSARHPARRRAVHQSRGIRRDTGPETTALLPPAGRRASSPTWKPTPAASMLVDNRARIDRRLSRGIGRHRGRSGRGDQEQERPDFERLFLAKHPHLESFVRSPSCVLLRLRSRSTWWSPAFSTSSSSTSIHDAGPRSDESPIPTAIGSEARRSLWPPFTVAVGRSRPALCLATEAYELFVEQASAAVA